MPYLTLPYLTLPVLPVTIPSIQSQENLQTKSTQRVGQSVRLLTETIAFRQVLVPNFSNSSGFEVYLDKEYPIEQMPVGAKVIISQTL